MVPLKKDSPAPGRGVDGFGSLLINCAVGVVLLVHCFVLMDFFGGLSAMVSSEPLLSDDHSWHFYYSILGRRFLGERGTTWGYDPYLMAGYPTDVFDTSDRLLKVALVPLGFISVEAGYKLLNFALAAITPLLFFAAGRWFGLDRRVSLLVTVLGVWAWWSGGGLEIFAVGMAGFGLASIFGLVVAALLRRFMEAPSWRAHLLLLAAAPLALLIHPGIAVIIVVPGLAFYLLRWRKMTWKQHGFLVLTGLLAIGANLFWILPYLMNSRFVTGSQTHFQDPLFFLGLLGIKLVRQYSLVVPLLIVAGPIGLVQMHRHGHRELAMVLGFCILSLLFISMLGGLFSWLRKIQSVRYGLALIYFLVFPAAFAIFPFAQNLFRVKLPFAKRRLGLAVMAPLILSLFVSLMLQWLRPPIHPFVGMDREVVQVRDWLIQNTDRSARVLIEDNGPYSGDVFQYCFPTSPLAYYSGRELIGGPHWATYLQQHHADLSGFLLFGRGLFTFKRNDLAAAMDLYNIGWVVVKSPLERSLFDQFPDLFQVVGEVEGHRCYRVQRHRSFFLEGRGRVRADYNRFRLSEVSTDSDLVVIAYHWHPQLFIPPPSAIVRVKKGDDPVGFIGILHPSAEMEITVKSWPWE